MKKYKIRKTNKRKGSEGSKCSGKEWRRKEGNRYVDCIV
jgi:hypothetical protein